MRLISPSVLLIVMFAGLGAQMKPFKWSGDLNVPDPVAVTVDPQGIRVTAEGWYFVRAVAMVFDRYLRLHRERSRFSKVI